MEINKTSNKDVQIRKVGERKINESGQRVINATKDKIRGSISERQENISPRRNTSNAYVSDRVNHGSNRENSNLSSLNDKVINTGAVDTASSSFKQARAERMAIKRTERQIQKSYGFNSNQNSELSTGEAVRKRYFIKAISGSKQSSLFSSKEKTYGGRKIKNIGSGEPSRNSGYIVKRSYYLGRLKLSSEKKAERKERMDQKRFKKEMRELGHQDQEINTISSNEVEIKHSFIKEDYKGSLLKRDAKKEQGIKLRKERMRRLGRGREKADSLNTQMKAERLERMQQKRIEREKLKSSNKDRAVAVKTQRLRRLGSKDTDYKDQRKVFEEKENVNNEKEVKDKIKDKVVRNKIKRIGGGAYNEVKNAGRSAKNEVLNNVEGGDDLNKALHYGVSAPASTGRKAAKVVKEGIEGAKLRKQRRLIRKELKQKERALYAKYYANKDSASAKKELKKIRRIDKKALKKRGFKFSKMMSRLSVLSFMRQGAESLAKKTIRGANSHANAMDPGQRGAYALMRTFSPLTPFRIGAKIVELFAMNFKILLVGLLVLVVTVAVIGGTAIGALKASPVGVVIDVIEFFSGGNDSDKEYATGFTKDKFKDMTNDIQNELNSSGENKTVTANYDREEGIDNTNHADILAVFAVLHCQNGEFASGELNDDLKGKIEDIFSKGVSYERSSGSFEENGNTVETVNITVKMKNWKSLAAEYAMTEAQKKQTEEIYNMIKESIPDDDIAFPVSGTMGDYVWYGDGVATDIQLKIADNAKNNNGWYPAVYGYCAQWVAGIYAQSGAGRPYGDAKEYWYKWQGTGSNRKDNIPIGAAVVTGPTASNSYGHIGIYIGNGMVASNLGGVVIESVESFASGKYGAWLGWCWPNGNVLGPTPDPNNVDLSNIKGEWKRGTASAYGGFQDASVDDNARTATGDVVNENTMGVAVPMAWGGGRTKTALWNYLNEHYYGKTVYIRYNGKTVKATINDCGSMGGGSRVLDLQPGVTKAFGVVGARNWGLREVEYMIVD